MWGGRYRLEGYLETVKIRNEFVRLRTATQQDKEGMYGVLVGIHYAQVSRGRTKDRLSKQTYQNFRIQILGRGLTGDHIRVGSHKLWKDFYNSRTSSSIALHIRFRSGCRP